MKRLLEIVVAAYTQIRFHVGTCYQYRAVPTLPGTPCYAIGWKGVKELEQVTQATESVLDLTEFMNERGQVRLGLARAKLLESGDPELPTLRVLWKTWRDTT